MAFKKEENNIFFIALAITVTIIPLVATQNIDCKGKAFHCVNSTHFKICVDLGGGISTTVDDFVIPCPRNTVCKDNNYFECEYVPTTTLEPTQKSEVPNDISVTPSLKKFDIVSTFYDKTSENKLSDIVVSTTPSSTLEFSDFSTPSVLQIVTSDLSASDKSTLYETTLIEASTTNQGLTSTNYAKVTLDTGKYNDKIKNNLRNTNHTDDKTKNISPNTTFSNSFNKDYKNGQIRNSTSIFIDSPSNYRTEHENQNNELTIITNITLEVFTNTSPVDSKTKIVQDSYDSNYVTNEVSTENIITKILYGKEIYPNAVSKNAENLTEIKNIQISSDHFYNVRNITTDKSSNLKYTKNELSAQELNNTKVEVFGEKIVNFTIDFNYASTTDEFATRANNSFSMAVTENIKPDNYTVRDKNTFYDTTTLSMSIESENFYSTEKNNPINYLQIVKNSTSTPTSKTTKASNISYTTVDHLQNIARTTLNNVTPFKNILSPNNELLTTEAVTNVNFELKTIHGNETKNSLTLENLNNGLADNESHPDSFLKLDHKANTEIVFHTYTVEPLPKVEEVSNHPYMIQPTSQSITTKPIGDSPIDMKTTDVYQLSKYENSKQTTPTLYGGDKINYLVDSIPQSKANDSISFKINVHNESFTKAVDININKSNKAAINKIELPSEANMRNITQEMSIAQINYDYDEITRVTYNNLSTEKLTNTIGGEINNSRHEKIGEKLSTIEVKSYLELKETSSVNPTEFREDDSIVNFITTVSTIESEKNTVNVEATPSYNDISNTQHTYDIINYDAITSDNTSLRINSLNNTVNEIKYVVQNNDTLNNFIMANANSTESSINFTGYNDENIRILDNSKKMIAKNINKNHTVVSLVNVEEKNKLLDTNIFKQNETKKHNEMYNIDNFNKTGIDLKQTDDTQTMKSTNIIEFENKTDLNRSISNGSEDANIFIESHITTTQDIYTPRVSDNSEITMPVFNNSYLKVSGLKDIVNTYEVKQHLSNITETVDLDVNNKTTQEKEHMELFKNADLVAINTTSNQTLFNDININENIEIQIEKNINNTKHMDINSDDYNNTTNDTTNFHIDTTASTYNATYNVDIIIKNNSISENIMNGTNINDRIGMQTFNNSDFINLNVAEIIPYNDILIKVINVDTYQNSEINKNTVNNTGLSENATMFIKNITTTDKKINKNIVKSIKVPKNESVKNLNNNNSSYIVDEQISNNDTNKISPDVKNNEDVNLNVSNIIEKNVQIFYNTGSKDIKTNENTTIANIKVNVPNYLNKLIYKNNTFKDNITVTNTDTDIKSDINVEVEDMKIAEDTFIGDINFNEKDNKKIETGEDVKIKDIDFIYDKEVTHAYLTEITNGGLNESNKAVINGIKTSDTAIFNINITESMSNTMVTNNTYLGDDVIPTANAVGISKMYSNNIQNLQIYSETEDNGKIQIKDDIKLVKDNTHIISNTDNNNAETKPSMFLFNKIDINKTTVLHEYTDSVNQVKATETKTTLPLLTIIDLPDVTTKGEAVDNQNTKTSQNTAQMEMQKTSISQISTLNIPNLNNIIRSVKSMNNDAKEVNGDIHLKNIAADIILPSVSEEASATNVYTATNDFAPFISMKDRSVPRYSQVTPQDVSDVNIKSYNKSQNSNIYSSNKNRIVNSTTFFNSLVVHNEENKTSAIPKDDSDITSYGNEMLIPTENISGNNRHLLMPQSITSSDTTNNGKDVLLNNKTSLKLTKDINSTQFIPETLKFTTLPSKEKSEITHSMKDVRKTIEENKDIHVKMYTKEQQMQLTSSVMTTISATTHRYDAGQISTTHTVDILTSFTCEVRNHGKYPDENDCNKFYICIGEHSPLIGRCPDGTVYSDIKKQCTKKLSHCIRNNQFRCLAEGRFIDVLAIDYYYICAKNEKGFVRFKLKCQKNYYLNRNTIRCLPKEASFEDYSRNTSEKRTKESTSSETVKFSKSHICVEEGKFEYPEDCRKYYVCTRKSSEFRRRIKQCESDEVFNVDKKKCVDEESYECRF